MTDDSYPPPWGASPPPDPMDPRLGSVLEPSRPTAAEVALVAELVHLYVSRSTDFAKTWTHFWEDRYRDTRWPHVFLALLEQFSTTAVGSQGEQLSIARAAGDLRESRTAIAEFGRPGT